MHWRRMLGVVVDARWVATTKSFSLKVVRSMKGVGVALVGRELGAGDHQADAVAGFEDAGG